MRQYRRGEQIGGEYNVLDVFGGENESGMGVVYLVEHREAPFPFVLKTYQHDLDEDAKSQFIAEAHAWVNAGANAHIVQALWVRDIAGQTYVAAEYVAPDDIGRNNLTHFLQGGKLLTEIILMWAAQFCHGMDYARSKGVLAHRDIKPDNLMIAGDGSLKITDFGLAKSISLDEVEQKKGWQLFGAKQEAETAGKTVAGSVMGTLPYMAPEQLRDAKSVDHRADIYSFGVILYEMVTGDGYPYRISPDSQNIGLEYYQAHLSQNPIKIDSPLMPVIGKCLKKEPKRRYATYDAVLVDLHKIAKKLGLKIPLAEHVSQDDEELYAQAQSYVALGDKDRALRAIDEYVEKYPENFCGWTEKGRLHFERGEIEQALDATKQSLAENPYNTHAWNNLGIMLFHAEAPFDDVSEAYESALRLDGLNTAAMMNFVGPLIANNEHAKAAKLTARALRAAPDKPLVRAKADAVLLELREKRDIKSAIDLLNNWTRARPDDIDAWHNLGLFRMEENAHKLAIRCFLKVRQLKPDDDFAIVQLVKLYFWTEQYKECVECCNELLRKGIEPMLALSTKVRAISFQGGYQAALNILKQYLEHNPENDSLWMVLADIHEHWENYEAAVWALGQAREVLQRSSGPNVGDNLGFVNQKIRELSPLIPRSGQT